MFITYQQTSEQSYLLDYGEDINFNTNKKVISHFKYLLKNNYKYILNVVPSFNKLLIVFVLIGLSINLDSFLIGFISAVIISREIWVAALRDINSRNNQSDKTKVTFLAKTKTAIQMLSILMYLFGLTINNMMILFFADIILIIALLVTIQTGFQYTISTFKK